MKVKSKTIIEGMYKKKQIPNSNFKEGRIDWSSFGIWNLEFGTWNLELGTWNLELGTYLGYFPKTFLKKPCKLCGKVEGSRYIRIHSPSMIFLSNCLSASIVALSTDPG